MKQQCQGSSANERGLLCSISYFTSHLNTLECFSKEYIIDVHNLLMEGKNRGTLTIAQWGPAESGNETGLN